MTRAIIFDMDGTLIDSVDGHASAWQDAFAEYGHAFEHKAIRDQIGKGGDHLLPEFLTPADIERFGKALEKRRGDILKERYLPQFKPFPGVRALLQSLHDAGVTVALASSAKQDELKVYKRIAHIEDLVDAETSSDDAESSKPDPDIFEAAMKKLGNVDSVLVVGDTPYDAIAAGKAGLRAIGVRCGGFSDESLTGAGCVALYDGPADMLAQMGQLPFP